jgi:hypothetical protein
VTGIFKQKNPANIFSLLVLGVLVKLPMFMRPYEVVLRPYDGPLYKSIAEFLKPVSKSFPSLFAVLAFALLFLQAIMLTRIFNTQRMMNKANYFPGMAYMLITSLFSEWNYFSAPLLANTFLLFILPSMFKIYNQQNARGTIFNIGFYLGIATFIFFPAITFLLWIFLAFMLVRPFRVNEWIICIVGVTAPYYFYAIYLAIQGRLSWQAFLPYTSINLPVLQQSVWLAGSVALIAIPFLTGGYLVQDNLRRMLIHVRKGWSLLLIYLLVSLLVPFVNGSVGFVNWAMAAIPLAAFHACTYFYAPYKWAPLVLFWLMVAFILIYQYAVPGW